MKLVTGDFFAMLNRRGVTIAESPIKAEHLGKLLDLQADGTISGRIAKDLFVAMEETGKDPAVLVEERGMKQVTDTGAIEAAIKEMIAANPEQVEAYKAKPTMMGWFVGQVMKSTGGKANPKIVNESAEEGSGRLIRRCGASGVAQPVPPSARCSAGLSPRVRLKAVLISADMAEGLREVALLALLARLVLLGQQAEIVADGEQALEQLLRVVACGRSTCRRRRARSCRRGTRLRPALRPSLMSVRVVAHDEAVAQQRLLDRLDGADEARIVGLRRSRSAPAAAGWHRAGAVVGRRKVLRCGSKPLRADVGMDLVADLAPFLDRARRGRASRPP